MASGGYTQKRLHARHCITEHYCRYHYKKQEDDNTANKVIVHFPTLFKFIIIQNSFRFNTSHLEKLGLSEKYRESRFVESGIVRCRILNMSFKEHFKVIRIILIE